MDIKEFRLYVKRMHPMQSLAITFKSGRDSIDGLARLYSFVRAGVVSLASDGDKVVVLAVLTSSDWGGDRNRTITVCGLNGVDSDSLDQLSKDIESIKTADHAAKGLMSGREKMRDVAAKTITAAVLTPAFVREVEGWGFKVTGQLLGWHGIPCVAFMLTDKPDSAAFSTIILDGWSGRMAVQGTLGDEVYVKPEQLQALIRAAAEEKAESLTTA